MGSPLPLSGSLEWALLAQDEWRRAAGRQLDRLGLGPQESRWREVLRAPHFQLRAYGEPGSPAPPLLIVPAPIKAHYIWDLAPPVSVVKRAQAAGFQVFLVRWRHRADPDAGLARYALDYPRQWLAAVAGVSGQRPWLAGHSLGGTLAALFAAAHSEAIQGLLLVAAPLRFRAGGGVSSPLGQAVADWPLVPGSALSAAAWLAAPAEFVGGRWLDALASGADTALRRLHAQVLRWTLDELAMPGRLFREIIESLYRHDRFARGELDLEGRRVAPERLRGPVLVIAEAANAVVPTESALLEPTPEREVETLCYRPEPGVALQHVGPLVGPRAHRVLWPRALAWMRARSVPPAADRFA